MQDCILRPGLHIELPQYGCRIEIDTSVLNPVHHPPQVVRHGVPIVGAATIAIVPSMATMNRIDPTVMRSKGDRLNRGRLCFVRCPWEIDHRHPSASRTSTEIHVITTER